MKVSWGKSYCKSVKEILDFTNYNLILIHLTVLTYFKDAYIERANIIKQKYTAHFPMLCKINWNSKGVYIWKTEISNLLGKRAKTKVYFLFLIAVV